MEPQQVSVKHCEALDGTFSGDSRWLETIELTDFRSSVLNFSRLPCDTPGRPDVQHLPHLSLTALIESVEAQFDVKKRLFESKHGVDACKKLSRDEIMTIMAYTSATPALYLSLNAWMMVRRDQTISAIIGPFARRLITALGKLPELKCRAYRGVKVDGVAGLEKAYNNAGEILAKGSSVNFWGFCSFSTNADVANNFASDPECATARSIVYTCDEIRGVSVDCLSIAPREAHEVLLVPPALFRVEKVMGPTEGRLSLTISQLDSWDKEYILPLRPNPSSNLTVVVHSEVEFGCLDLTFPYFTKKLDVNRGKCLTLFGMRPGEKVKTTSGNVATLVGMAPHQGVLSLWFHVEGQSSITRFNDGEVLVRQLQFCDLQNSSDGAGEIKVAPLATVTVVEYDIVTDEFCFDYAYKCGTMHSRLELFDRRSEECNALFGVVPGQRVRDSLVGVGATAIGMRVKPDGKLAMWYHVDGSTGAGIYEEGTVLTVIAGDVRQLPATPVAANASQSFVTSKKVALPAEPLQLTFRYPAGVEQSRDLPFDIRRDVCLQHFGVEPGRRVRVHGDLATAIGMREDEGELTMWYHDDDNGGAGLYPPDSMIELTAVVVPIDRLTVLAEVPAEMIDLNLSKRAPVTGGGSELFDVRPEACVKFFRLCPGQRVRVLKTQQEATVVGMRNAAGRVQLWLSDATGARSYSAGTAIEVLDGELAPTGQSDHQLVVNHLPFDPSMELQQTFCYQTGARALSGEAMFDVREDVCRGLFGVVPGQRVLSDVGMATAVGMNHLPDGTLAMWYHLDGTPGAGTFLAGSTLTVTGSTVKLSPFVDRDCEGTIVTFDDDLPREPLQLHFKHRVGGSATESELRRKMGSDFDEARLTRYFDVRPEICQRFGVLPGQRVRVLGHEATAIGAAPDGGLLKMWYHQDDRYGAGLYPAGTEVRLTNKFVSFLAPNSAATDSVTCEPAFTGEDFIVKDVAVQPLELTVPCLRGRSKVSSMFDCRPEKCLELFGVSIGQKFVRDNGKVTTVFGMAGSASTIKLFFCEDGAEFVGAYAVGTRLTLVNP